MESTLSLFPGSTFSEVPGLDLDTGSLYKVSPSIGSNHLIPRCYPCHVKEPGFFRAEGLL